MSSKWEDEVFSGTLKMPEKNKEEKTRASKKNVQFEKRIDDLLKKMRNHKISVSK